MSGLQNKTRCKSNGNGDSMADADGRNLVTRQTKPFQILGLLREYEGLKPRTEQYFHAPYEKDMSSSEESSPMYREWKIKKLERIKLERQKFYEE